LVHSSTFNSSLGSLSISFLSLFSISILFSFSASSSISLNISIKGLFSFISFFLFFISGEKLIKSEVSPIFNWLLSFIADNKIISEFSFKLILVSWFNFSRVDFGLISKLTFSGTSGLKDIEIFGENNKFIGETDGACDLIILVLISKRRLLFKFSSTSSSSSPLSSSSSLLIKGFKGFWIICK